VIDEVGVGGNYLSHKHTREHFKSEVFVPSIGNRLVKGAWEKAGSKDVTSKAREKVKEILKSHKPDPVEKEIKKDLLKYIQNKKKQLLKGTR
jgi:trimethylamine--corrinoid protein Co-methyltransferase